MNADEIVKALRAAAAKWEAKNKFIGTGELRVHDALNDAAGLIESLTAQLAESQRRERAAAEAMKLIADEYREKVGDDGICGLCKQDADHGLDGYANECAGFYKNDCFEWRGPQDGEVER